MQIKTIAWNAFSLFHKKAELSRLIDERKLKLILISETWLTNQSNVSFPDFVCYRVDRFHGGVCIFIHKSIPHSFFKQIALDYAEAVFVKIHSDNGDLTVSSIYCSPAATRIQSQLFFTKVLSVPGPSVHAGDFNAKHPAWNNLNYTLNGVDLFNLCNLKHFKIHPPDRPTLIPGNIGKPSAVDFVISKSVPGVSSVKVLNKLSSDHCPIEFFIPFDRSALKDIRILNYKKADWKLFRSELNTAAVNLETNFPTLDSRLVIDKSIERLVENVHAAVERAIPKKMPSKFKYPSSSALQALTKARNHYRNQFLATGNTFFKSAKNQLNRLIKCETTKLNQKSFDDKLANLNTKDQSLYQLAKCLKSKQSCSPPLVDPDDKTLSHSNLDKANAFAKAFLNCHKTSLNMLSTNEKKVKKSIKKLSREKVVSPQREFFKADQLKDVIKSIKAKKAPGPDKISNSTIKAFPDPLLKFIVRLFNSCLKIAYFPTQWKKGKIIAIPKAGKDQSVATNFRPISLLSTIGKLFEKLILEKLTNFEDIKKIFIPQQCGFRNKHSTIHQVLRITEKATINFSKHKSTGLVLLDIEKAFDSVWHDALIHKLLVLKFPLFLVKIIQSYLADRIAFVDVQGNASQCFAIPAGVPQGSLLAPFLFNIFINDIKTPKNSELAIYADDTGIMCEATWKNAKSIKRNLEAAFNKVQKFFSSWKIKINSSKTELIVFSKSRVMKDKLKHFRPEINGATLDWSDVVTYLGVDLDSSLTMRAHIDRTISKANGVIKSLFCIFKRNSAASLHTKLTIYKAYIRPILTYAGTLIDNSAKTHFSRLQVMENKCLRMALSKPYGTRNSSLHEQAKLPTIKEFINNNTKNFYKKVEGLENPLLNPLGSYIQNPLPFRLLHKLPRSC